MTLTAIEISQKVLTENLRAMEADGIITRTVYPEVPPKVKYSSRQQQTASKEETDAAKKEAESAKAGTKSVTIKKLKSHKKYYIRVRAYKKIGAKTVYTPYSVISNTKVR